MTSRSKVASNSSASKEHEEAVAMQSRKNSDADIFKLDESNFFSHNALKFLDEDFPKLNKIVDLDVSKPEANALDKSHVHNQSSSTIELNESMVHKDHHLVELNLPTSGSISNETLRRGFIRKVLSIIMVQFSISVAFTFLALYSEPVQKLMLKHWYVAFLMILAEIVFFITLSCYQENCRKTPRNYILLLLFTLATTYVTAFLCVVSASVVVLIAILATVFFVLGLILYIFFTNRDLTFNIAILLYLPIGVVFIVVFLSTWPGHLGNAMISMFIVALFGMYLIYDMQKLSSKFGEEYKIDDYIIAALTIYTDIILIFKQLIMLLSGGAR
jgi:protein lifeguard